jgi:hypothetical protein
MAIRSINKFLATILPRADKGKAIVINKKESYPDILSPQGRPPKKGYCSRCKNRRLAQKPLPLNPGRLSPEMQGPCERISAC